MAEKRYIRLSVEDAGEGPHADLADQMFVPFVTSDTTGRRLGLGLYYVEVIALGLGGAALLRRDTARTVAEIYVPEADESEIAASEGEQGSVDALRHVALVSRDEAWVPDFTALSAQLGAHVSVFADWEGIPPEDIENGRYSAAVISDACLDGAFARLLNDNRMPFVVLADNGQAILGDHPEDIRPFNIVMPESHSAAETLHRLMAFGALH